MLESSSTMASPPASPMTCLTRTSSKTKVVFHLDDYSEEEVNACWYDAFEMSSIQTKLRATVAMMERATIHEDETKHCAWGLDKQTREGSGFRHHNRTKARYAVLHAQERQKRDAIVDEYKIAEIYSEHTAMCQIQAHIMAVSYAHELQLDRSSSSSNLNKSSSVPKMCALLKSEGRRFAHRLVFHSSHKYK
jgi:hypothetical protein